MRGQGGERTARSVLVVRSLRSSLLDARRRAGRSRPVLLLLLLLLTLALAAASDPQPRWFPVAMLVVPVLAGGFLLRFRLLLLLYAAVVAAAISE